MESQINPIDLENFWIRVYLGANKDLMSSAIDRAYRDFNRTQHGFAKVKTNESYPELKKGVVEIILQLLDSKFESQEEFDEWHECKCNYLIDAYDEIVGFKISFGQAQKWINMSLKYLYALGDSRIPKISVNYRFFHIPIDNIIQDALKIKLAVAWSRIETYEQYLAYQKEVRAQHPGQILMDVEFQLFNQLK